MKAFDVVNIDLKNNNLIEASAGTGKTYSIGILVLRLLLEKNISIRQILMVTFTNAAVAELEIRIRLFLRDAFKISKLPLRAIDSNNNIIDTEILKKIDPTILQIVEQSIKEKGIEETQQLLSGAILFLDETSIFTIHSFCQVTLSEFAFETKQLFNTELIEDQTSIIEEAVNEFWRTNITGLDINILKILSENKFSRELLIEFSKSVFNGKKLKIGNTISQDDILKKLEEFQEKIDTEWNKFENEVKSQWNTILGVKLRKNTKLQKARDNDGVKEFCAVFFDLYIDAKRPQYIDNFDFIFQFVDDIIVIKAMLDTFKIDVLVHFLYQTQKYVQKEVERKKSRNQVLSFHDLIEKLHTELVKNNNTELKNKLCSKYKAVFIDEFQDTDHLQYEIFQKAFIENCNSTVFFIGDPKQSIYAWRGADLKTYIKAQKDIGENKFTMKNNFRSTAPLVNAMNEFFPAGRFCNDEEQTTSNPFCSEDINYEIVNPANKSLPTLYRNNIEASSFDIIQHAGKNSKEDLFEAAGREIVDLLSNYYLEKEGVKRKVAPDDIRVLVRSRKETKLMKEILLQYDIPAVIIDDTKVLHTDEAGDLYYLLFAIENLDYSSIARALLTSFMNFDSSEITTHDFEFHNKQFLELQEIWKKSGIYSAIINFTVKYKVIENLLEGNNPRGNRIYTNLMQLAEILNEKELYSNYSTEKLLDWLQKAREGLGTVNKYEQRIESDENAVEILTIHKSKGLSFNIVVMPQLNLNPISPNKVDYLTYPEDDGFYVSYYKTPEEIKLYNFQNEQENRRLLYVAITRAVYKCIIHFNNQTGTLNSFIPNIENINSKHINFREPLPEIDYKYSAILPKKDETKPLSFNKYIGDTWRLTSYSALDTHNISYKIEKEPYSESTNEYDKFIFNKLQKGAQTGLLLHDIFERIDFSNSKFWNTIIENILQQSGKESIELENYRQLLNHTVKANLIPPEFNLSVVEYNARFNELEFYFAFDNWDGNRIKELVPNIDISNQNINGIMHGFIDLLFEHKGKYYILDWKSNHLGYNIDDYSVDKLEEAMTNSNYHLQYLVYTIAVKRFLQDRVTNFDYDKHFGGVFYLFLRGLRANQNTGVFYNKPEKTIIDKLEKIIK